MVVEVVTGKVGEHTSREGQSVQAPLIQTVGGCFHGHVGHPTLHHSRERRLKIDGSRSCQRPRGRVDRLVPAIECAERSDAAGPIVFIEEMADEPRRSRLSIGPGNAD